MADRIEYARHHWYRPAGALALTALAATLSCSSPPPSPYRTYSTPEDAVKALTGAVEKGNVDEVVAIFGPDGKDLIDSSDPVTARHNREVFTVAVKEGWRLVDQDGSWKTLVIGKEAWPFPVPLVHVEEGWRFDTDAGKEEVLARRIGRNELAAIKICLAYVNAQRRYAKQPHDGKRAGLYAATFRSDPGKQNGLYWRSVKGQRPSPLGDLVAKAAAEGQQPSTKEGERTPLHGYYFKILTAQGAAARGGAMDYVANGEMSGGFALVAWPAQYDSTGVMTFIVNHEGIPYEKDLGPSTDAAARAMSVYNPDDSWSAAQYR